MKSVRYPVFALIALVLLSACSTTSTPKTRYYLIAP